MKFETYYKLTIKRLSEEIINDNKLFLNKICLFESPLYHEADFFSSLNDIKTNHPFCLERKEDSEFIQNVTINGTEYSLYRKLDGDSIWDFYIKGEEGHELLYAFLKYKINKTTIELEGLWQIEFVLGLVRNLITHYYSKHFSILESGNVTNNKGKKFYKKLAEEFISNKKKVTVFFKDKEIPFEIKDSDSYWKSGDGTNNYEKRFRFYF